MAKAKPKVKSTAAPRRVATYKRSTGETLIDIRIDVDGTGKHNISTGLEFFDHMISQLSRHSAMDIDVTAKAKVDPDGHHTVEDVGIALGKCFNEALGDKRGIVRMAHAIVPLDEALSMVSVDISGRGYAEIDMKLTSEKLGDTLSDLLRHFLQSFAYEARINLHANVMAGVNDHHKAEATFKALAKALYHAVKIDPRIAGELPSTKGVIEK